MLIIFGNFLQDCIDIGGYNSTCLNVVKTAQLKYRFFNMGYNSSLWYLTVNLIYLFFWFMLSACTASFYWEPTENPAKDSEGKDEAASILV